MGDTLIGYINGYIGFAILLVGVLIGWFSRAAVDRIGEEDEEDACDY